MTIPSQHSPLVGITGASGFIGSYLSPKLQAQFQVRPLIRSRAVHNLEVFPNASFGDLADSSAIKQFVSGLTTLVHLANSNFPRDAEKTLSEDIEMNLVHTVRLFEIFSQQNPTGHIIFFSSGGAVYDPFLAHELRKESDPTNPISSYGIQKLAAEHFLAAICARSGISATILRVSNPYGTLLPPERAQGIVGVAMACIKHDLPFRFFGSPSAVRDYVHLDDVTSATLTAIQNPAPAGKCRIFNVGSGVGIQSDQLIATIEKAAGKKLQLTRNEAKSPEPSWNVLDISKIKKELGWSPQIPLFDGLQMTFRKG